MPQLANQTFEYRGKGQRFVVPVSGEYLLELWGAQGGYAVGHPNHRTPQNKPISQAKGGLGGYTKGKIKLKAAQVLYVFVGGQGNPYVGSSTLRITGGFNGGGSSDGCNTDGGGGGGGGATHISTENSILQSCSPPSVLIVSGGGGGAWGCKGISYSNARGLSEGGNGGDLTGGTAGYGGTMGYTTEPNYADYYNQKYSDKRSGAYNFATGGTQTSGGYQGCYQCTLNYAKTSSPSGFGKGADSGNAASHSGGGGGGGYYGGGAGTSGNNPCGTGGGGGSSYVSSSIYENLMLQGVNEGNGKVVISPVFIDFTDYYNNFNEYKTCVNCPNIMSAKNYILILLYLAMSE